MAGAEGQVLMENAEIAFRNFAGREGAYNREGDRSFHVMLDDSLAQQMERDGLNVKQLKSRDGEEGQKHLQVAVKYRNRDGSKARTQPTVWLVTSKGRTALDEESIEILDYMDIARVDLVVRFYEWAYSGRSGVKAVLKSMFFFVAEDQLELRYRDIPEIGEEDRPAIEAGGDSDVIDAEAWYEDEDQKAIEG